MAGYLSRCPRCGSAGDEDAAQCTRCGGTLRDEVVVLEPAGVAGHRPVSLAVDARPRTVPVRLVTPALAAVFVVGVVLGRVSGTGPAAPTVKTTTAPALAAPPDALATTTTTTTPPPFLDQPAGTKLVLARDEELALVDLDANTVSKLPVPGLSARRGCPGCAGPAPLARVGDHLVFQADGSTSAVPLDLSAPPRVLRRSLLFVPSWREGRVWLVERGRDNNPVVVEVDLAGRVTSPARALPIDWVPHVSVAGGLVLRLADRFQVWDPTSGQVRLAGESAMPIAASGDVVAWAHYCEGPLCAIHFTDVRTGRDRAVPIGLSVNVWPGSLSPDGRKLAFLGYDSDGPADGGPQMRIVVLDVATGEEQAVPFTEAPGAALVWSPSAQWLFVLSHEGHRPALHAYRVGAPGTVPVRLPVDVVGFALVAL